MSKEIKAALAAYDKEKNIPPEKVAEKLCRALESAAKKKYGQGTVCVCTLDPKTYDLKLVIEKTVVAEVENDKCEMTVEDAVEYKADAVVGDVIQIPVDISKFGKRDASSVKTTIRGGIKDIEKEQLLETANAKNTESIKAKVIMVDPKSGDAKVRINGIDADLPRSEQIPGETIAIDDIVDVYIAKVSTDRPGEPKTDNYKVVISRINPGLVKRLFEKEVSEIYDGIVEIKSIAREAGSRTKIAVSSADKNIDPVGACIGENGARIKSIISQINGEKIDIVKFSEIPSEFISAALAPAEIVSVEILDADKRTCRVNVPEKQLSLAIGNKGQNARLAAKLTGWKIDIKPYYGEETPYAVL